jgi:hypothetical protein
VTVRALTAFGENQHYCPQIQPVDMGCGFHSHVWQFSKGSWSLKDADARDRPNAGCYTQLVSMWKYLLCVTWTCGVADMIARATVLLYNIGTYVQTHSDSDGLLHDVKVFWDDLARFLHAPESGLTPAGEPKLPCISCPSVILYGMYYAPQTGVAVQIVNIGSKKECPLRKSALSKV